jgi:predicted ATP-grasp superfamily ATP-dependent carboligase
MIIQERIPKKGLAQGVSILMNESSSCIAAFAHQRNREYPISGGPSTDRVSILAPQLVELSIHLLKELKWQGIAMVEWKIDPRDGQPKLMEINPRFWGSLELAIRSGVDFPTLYARVASGEMVRPVLNYRVGVQCRWMIPGEILHYFNQPPSQKESWKKFLQGLPQSAEEWDSQDWSGLLATLICTGALAFNPRYWKYLRRG